MTEAIDVRHRRCARAARSSRPAPPRSGRSPRHSRRAAAGPRRRCGPTTPRRPASRPTKRRLQSAFVSATFWWISLFANRVRRASAAATSASASVAPAAVAIATARSAIASQSCVWSVIVVVPLERRRGSLEHADLHVAEPCPRDRVADVADLAGLALAAVRRAEHPVARGVAHGVARAPQLVRDARVGRVLDEPALLAALDLVARPRSRTGSSGAGRRWTSSGTGRGTGRRRCRPRCRRGSSPGPAAG